MEYPLINALNMTIAGAWIGIIGFGVYFAMGDALDRINWLRIFRRAKTRIQHMRRQRKGNR